MKTHKHSFFRFSWSPLLYSMIILTALMFRAGMASATDCPGATAVPASPTLPYTITLSCGTTNDINSANATVCGSANYQGGYEALYVWTPGGDYSDVSFAYSGQTWTGVFLYEGCPTTGGICLANVTSSGSSKTLEYLGTNQTSGTKISVTAGVTYYIMIDIYPTPDSPCPGTLIINGTLLPPCTGTPNPGNTLTSSNPACPSVDFTLSLQNPTAGAGVSYTWQSSTDSLAWAATGTTTSTMTGNQTVVTWYRCIVSCSGNADTSNAVKVTMNAWQNCYCTSTSTDPDSYFDSFTTSGGVTNISNTSSGYSANGYGDFTAMSMSQNLNGTVNFTTALEGTTVGVGIWVDWNQNGTFDDAGEEVYMTTGYVTTCSGSFNVPATAVLGATRMRIRMDYNNSTPDICGEITYGETEDYTFNVLAVATCFTPTALGTSNVTTSSVDFAWTTGGAAIWNIQYGPVGFTPGTGNVIHNVTSASHTINGLAPGTTYDVYVQDSCGAGDVSIWAGPVTFTTLCVDISTFPWNEGFEIAVIPNVPNCWLVQNGDWVTTNNANNSSDADARTGAQFLREKYSATNEYVWTPGFQLTAGTSYDFSFWWAGDDYDTWDGEVFCNSIQDSTGAQQLGAAFVVNSTTTTTTYEQVIRTFIPSTTGVYYFAIRVNAPITPYYLSFDDFKLELTPTCTKSNTLSSGTLTTASAVLDWVPTGSAAIWNIEYGPAGFTPGTGTIIHNVTSHPYTLNGLSASTTYEWYVQDSCGAGDVSEWAGPASFTTLCGAISTFPWNEGFETAVIPNVPDCWLVQNGDWETTDNANSSYDADARTGAQFLSESWSAIDEYVWTPGFQLTAGTGYVFSFWWAGDNYDTWDGEVFCNGTQDSTGAQQLGAAFVVDTTTTTTTYEQVIRTFTPSTSGVYYFAIRVNAPFTPYYLSFDDFKLEQDTLTGIDRTNDLQMTILPNPTSGQFTIDFGGATGKTAVTIADLAGKIIVNESINLLGNERTTYDLSTYGKGLYTIRIVNNNNVAVQKIVVQ